MIELGPHRFTDQDAARTMQEALELFDLLPGAGTAPTRAAVASARRAAAEVVEGWEADPQQALEGWWGHWHRAMDELRRSGAFGPTIAGDVVALFRGDGGVPKRFERNITVDWSGVVGDRQADRRNHGRPWQALCLWSLEVIEALAAAGHPVSPGGAGENITVRGLPWERVVPGARLRVGTVLAEISAYADPCRTIAGSFLNRRFDVVHHRRGPVSRVYATVLEPGVITVGDQVVLEPVP